MGLFDLLRFSFSSLIWGILITAVCLILFFTLIRGWYRNASLTFTCYIVGLLLFFLLSFQCTLIVGALKVISISDFYKTEIQQIIQQYFSESQEVTLEQSMQIVEGLVDEYPVLSHFFQSGKFLGYTAAQLPEVIRQTMCSYLRWFIVRRLLWCLAFVIIGAVVSVRSMSVPVQCSSTSLSHRKRRISQTVHRRR